MSDTYFNEIVESKNATLFDIREEYDWWIGCGLPHEQALKFAKSAEVHVLQRKGADVNGNQDSRC